MVPVLYSSKYIYSIQTDTNLISIYGIDSYAGKLQLQHNTVAGNTNVAYPKM